MERNRFLGGQAVLSRKDELLVEDHCCDTCFKGVVWHRLWIVFLYLVSSGSIAVHADSSVQLLAEEAVAIENLDTNVYKRYATGNCQRKVFFV